jgi:Na+/H+ antiporter NhaD/arsenite permease-like protein
MAAKIARHRVPGVALRAVSGSNLRKLVVPAVIVGVVLIVVAVIYFVTPEHSLPSFFLGHASASSAEANHHHTKHGIAALVVGLACFAFAWFQTGPKAKAAGSDASPPAG